MNHFLDDYEKSKVINSTGEIVCKVVTALTTFRVIADKNGKTFKYGCISNKMLDKGYDVYTDHLGPVRMNRELINFYSLECNL